MKIKTLIRFGVEGAAIAVFPGVGLLIGMNELVNLSSWLKKRKGDWNEEDENKALVLKMMAANPSAAVELFGKAFFKGQPPEAFKVASKVVASGMSFTGSDSSLLGADKGALETIPPKKE